MKQFDLKEYLANPSRKLVTGDGRKVKILCTNRKSLYPIVALVENHDSDNESVCSYREDGLYSMFSLSEENNLFFAPEKYEGWVNIYKSKYDGYELSQVYQRKEDAETEKYINDSDVYVTTTKIEWEE